MPIAPIHVHEGRDDEPRLAKLGEAMQSARDAVLTMPPDDDFRIVHILPPHRFVHTPSFLGLTDSEDVILLKLTFSAGRPQETRLVLLQALNERLVAATGIWPDDLSVLMDELPGEHMSCGQGVAQRAHIAA